MCLKLILGRITESHIILLAQELKNRSKASKKLSSLITYQIKMKKLQ